MTSRASFWNTLTDPLIRQNPITLQILGICSALAVTTTLATAVTMSVSLTVVLSLAAGIISVIRRHIPDTIRLIVQIVIVASLVIVIDQILQAYFTDISRALSLEPRHFNALAGLGIILERVERPGPALAAWMRVKALYPDFHGAIEAIDRLEPIVRGKEL